LHEFRTKTDTDSIVGLLKKNVSFFEQSPGFKVKYFSFSASYNSFPELATHSADSVFTASLASYDIVTGISLANIPLSISGSNLHGFKNDFQNGVNSLYHLNFDYETYLKNIRSTAIKKVNSSEILSSITSRIRKLRATYEQQLQSELEDLVISCDSGVRAKLPIPASLSDLSFSDLNVVREKLFGSLTQEPFSELSFDSKVFNTADSASQGSVGDNALKSYEVLGRMMEKIEIWKERFNGDKNLQDLNSNLLVTQSNLPAYLNNPANLNKVVAKYANLSVLQNIFMHLTKFNTGQNGVDRDDFSVKGIVNTGTDIVMKMPSFSAGLLAGRNSAGNNLLQNGLESFITNQYSSLLGISIGSGYNKAVDQSVALNLFNFSGTDQSPLRGYNDRLFTNAGRKDAVIAYNTSINVSKDHQLSLSISKSFGSYKNDSLYAPDGASKSTVANLFSSGSKNFAFKIDYKGVVYNTNIQLGLMHTGLGFNNPGNIWLRRGEERLVFGLDRKFFKNKFSLQYKGDVRMQSFDPDKNYTSFSMGNRFKAGWRFRRDTRVGLMIYRNNFKFNYGDLKLSNSVNYLYQADGSFKLRAFNRMFINMVSANFQQVRFPTADDSITNGKIVMFSYGTLLQVSKHVLSFNTSVNRSGNNSYYFSASSILAEFGHSVTLPGGSSISSTIGYYDNAAWNRQIGARICLVSNLFKGCAIDLLADYKKSVKVFRPEFANQLFINASIRYGFGKQ
jgi:hypothetical protein